MFEIEYNYYKKNDDGTYNTNEIFHMKKKIGSPYEEIPYEKLAALIMGQLARRDIMVIDADIFEFTKKKISFKEATGGILIKGRKYSYELPEELPAVDVDEENYEEDISHPVQKQPVQKNIIQMHKPTNAPIRYEYFEPHKDLIAGIKKADLKFTIGKQYPIYEERPDKRGVMFGMQYITVDDESKKQILSDKLFVFRARLEGGSQFQESGNPALDYGATVQGDVPVLR